MITAQTFTAGIVYAQDPRRAPLDLTTVEMYILHHPHNHHGGTPICARDPLGCNKTFRDENRVRKEYVKALPMLQIMSSGRPFGQVGEDEVSKLDSQIRDLEAENRDLRLEIDRLRKEYGTFDEQLERMREYVDDRLRARRAGRSSPPVSTSAISEDAAYTRGQGMGVELYLYSETYGGSGHINLHGDRRPPRPGKTPMRQLGTVEDRGNREDRGLRDRK
jgi:hypothetical protein